MECRNQDRGGRTLDRFLPENRESHREYPANFKKYRYIYPLNLQNTHMPLYSDERRPVLAQWIKYTLFINVVVFILVVLFWILIAGLSAAITHTGSYATVLMGLNVAAFLFYEKLLQPEDSSGRIAAEVLGSLQVAAACLELLLILGTVALAVSPGLAGVLPLTVSQPVTTAATQAPVAAATTAVATPTECYQTAQGCMPLPPTVTMPPRGNPVAPGDPIIGSFIFDKVQFSPKQNYYSRAGNYEYNYLSVPLDHSPDITWTFRDDGVLLFTDTTNGNLLRTGTWTKTDLGKGKAEYKIRRGNYDYRGQFQDTVFRITSPDFWNMTKTE
jgi:hypothetical protein